MASFPSSSCSSSSTNTKQWKHDVFLSFRGQDTRNTFTGHLYQALCTKGINTFIDDKLERGEEISAAILQVIEESRISIVVFSENYAESSHCLDELVKIVECKESKGQMVFPVFYNVDPSHVTEQRGSFGDALFSVPFCCEVNIKKLQKWREALTKAARLSGWCLDNGNEAEFIQNIVEDIFTKLNHKSLHVTAYPVGLDSHTEDIIHKLDIGSNDVVLMVGVCGIGGIGKTTIAKAVYNQIVNQFEGSCFLANVADISKQYGLVQLQEQILCVILGDKNVKLGSIDRGINVIRYRLCNKKVLLVIDDVDCLDQLEQLAGEQDWFGLGSRIIITTRNERLLFAHQVERIHKVNGLCPDDALQLFSWNAFRNPHPPEDYLDLSLRVVQYVKGLPLALVVLGCSLYGRSIPQWESELGKLKRSPNKQIYKVLKTSFDGLEDHEKAIFLDIACFFKGKEKDYVIKILDACDFNPIIGIQVLIEKSLIYIENNKLQMHELLQSMGKQVVYQESPITPGRRSRLWLHDDILHVLGENMGSSKVEGIMLDSPDGEEVHLGVKAFGKMKRLRILIVNNAQVTKGLENLPNELRWLEWPGCPLESMPSRFCARKLVVLNMHRSHIKLFGEAFKNYSNLKYMDLKDCEFLMETPDFSTIPNLEWLNLEGCTSLVKIHPSIGFLDKLVFLSLEFCSNLRSLPSCFKLRSLQTLLLTSCTKVEKLPNFMDRMTNVEKLCLNWTAINELPLSIENLTGLKVLALSFCNNLYTIPSSIYKLQHLKHLLLEGCSKLDKFPENVDDERQPISVFLTSNYALMGFSALTCLDIRNCNLSDVDFLMTPNCFSTLKDLDLSGNNFVCLPACIRSFTKLRYLNLENCKWLQEIPELPQNVKNVRARDCKSLERYLQLSGVLKFIKEEGSKRLHDLDFSNCHKLSENQGKSMTSSISLQSTSHSERFRDNFQIEIFLPGSEIPEGFNYYGENGYLSFKMHSRMYGKILALALCTVVSLEDGETVNISRQIFINGQNVVSFSRQFFSLESDHLWLYYLPCRLIRGFNSVLENNWSHFEVSFKVLESSMNATLKRCGVYLVYKQDEKGSSPSMIPRINQAYSSHVHHDDIDSSLNTCDESIEISKTCESVSLDLTRSCNDDAEFYGYPQKKRWKRKREESPVEHVREVEDVHGVSKDPFKNSYLRRESEATTQAHLVTCNCEKKRKRMIEEHSIPCSNSEDKSIDDVESNAHPKEKKLLTEHDHLELDQQYGKTKDFLMEFDNDRESEGSTEAHPVAFKTDIEEESVNTKQWLSLSLSSMEPTSWVDDYYWWD